MFGLDSYKPLITALVMPPVPFVLLILLGARLILPRRGLGWLLVLLGLSGIWLGSCQGTGRWLQNVVLRPPMALSLDEIERLRVKPAAGQGKAAKAQADGSVAIVVLGGGMVPRASEYGVSDLSPTSAERLRYAVWLSRQTGLPLAFSGGVGWAQQQMPDAPAEADIAVRVAQQTYGQNIRWLETHSSDTRGNAALTVQMLKQAGVREIVLVTHAAHMHRALLYFEQAAGDSIRITPAPIASFTATGRPVLDWLPSVAGYTQVWMALHEVLGLALKA